MSILQYRLILALRPAEPNVLPGGLFRRAGAVSLGENVSECDILVSLARWARGRWIDFDIASPGVLRSGDLGTQYQFDCFVVHGHSRFMARLARIVVSAVPHHVTQRGNRRQTVFFGD